MFLFIHKTLPNEQQSVLDAVALLDITEYELFKLAYQNWFGEEIADPELEPYYVRYMFYQEIPPWVRYYVRKIQYLEKNNKLNKNALGIEIIPFSARMFRKGLKVILGLIFLVVFLIVLASVSGEGLTFLDQCYFPPCY